MKCHSMMLISLTAPGLTCVGEVCGRVWSVDPLQRIGPAVGSGGKPRQADWVAEPNRLIMLSLF